MTIEGVVVVRTPSDPARRAAAALVFQDRHTGETGTIAQRDEDGLFVFYPHGQQHPPELVLEPGRFARVPEGGAPEGTGRAPAETT